jgi:hypothetical protein
MEDHHDEEKSKTKGAHSHAEKVVKQAHGELCDLLHKKANITQRIGSIKQTIAGLADLFGNDVISEEVRETVDRNSHRRQPGLTDACRSVLTEAGKPLSAREVCDLINEKKATLLAHHKDRCASVTTILNRFVQYGEAEAVITKDGKRAWKWTTRSDESRHRRDKGGQDTTPS